MKLKTNRQEMNIEWIATLRGVAAFFVFFSHLFIDLPMNLMFIFGRVGVVCFFLMTGYLALEAREKRTGVQYIVNRFIRIYPVYWLLLLCMYLTEVDKVSLKELLWNFTLFEEFVGYECMIGASWMLPIQLIFFVGLGVAGKQFFVKGGELPIENSALGGSQFYQY